MSGEKVEAEGGSAIGDSVKEGLGPVPGGVDSDGPPERTGAPEAQTKDERGETGANEPEGTFAGVAAMDGAKPERDKNSGDPEACCLRIDAGGEAASKSGEAPAEGVLQVAAEEVLFKETDGEKAGDPLESVAQDVRAEEKPAVNDE